MEAIAYAIAVALIGVVALFLTPVRKILFGPVLRVVGCKWVTTEVGVGCQVLVASTGIVTAIEAINCKAKLTAWVIRESDVYEDETVLKAITFRNTLAIQSESLRWSKQGDPEAININPSDIEAIDLFLFKPDLDKPILMISPGHGLSDLGGKALVHLRPSNYTFRVTVSGSNAIAGSVDLEFRENLASESGDPWMICCLRRNYLRPFRLPSLPGAFDLRWNRG